MRQAASSGWAVVLAEREIESRWLAATLIPLERRLCARVHDAVRRANPNQFVMTLFSSRASLASCCETRFLFVFARMFTSGYWIFKGNARASDAVIYCCTPAASSIFAWYATSSPVYTDKRARICICFQFAWCAERGAKSEIKRAVMNVPRNGKKWQLDPEFPSASALCEICVAVFFLKQGWSGLQILHCPINKKHTNVHLCSSM